MADRPKAKSPAQRGGRNDSRPNGKAPKKNPKDPSRNARANKTPEQIANIERREAARLERRAERRAAAEAAAIAKKQAEDQAALRREANKVDREARNKRRAEAKERLAQGRDAAIRIHVAKSKAGR